jgi:DNA-binding CsgD family transcriptional regulator
MNIRHRPMQQKDVRECAEIVASALSARRIYEDTLGDLNTAWLRLLDCEAKIAVVFEEVTGTRARICAIGVSVFVQDEFVKELKARPFWFPAELTRRMHRGQSPILSERQFRDANSRGGLSMVVWEGRIAPGFEENPEVYRKLANVFLESHRGFFLKEAIGHHVETVERLQLVSQIGGKLWDPIAGCYTSALGTDPEEILKSPHVLGLSREEEIRRPGSWMGGLFEYQPPQFGFSRSEQRLLLLALNGGTDHELSRQLGISPFTVKKTWRAIYERVGDSRPELIPFHSAAENGTFERGRGKKQRLIAYLREHLEELRPISRKLLLQRGAHERSSQLP